MAIEFKKGLNITINLLMEGSLTLYQESILKERVSNEAYTLHQMYSESNVTSCLVTDQSERLEPPHLPRGSNNFIAKLLFRQVLSDARQGFVQYSLL